MQSMIYSTSFDFFTQSYFMVIKSKLNLQIWESVHGVLITPVLYLPVCHVLDILHLKSHFLHWNNVTIKVCEIGEISLLIQIQFFSIQ